MSEDKKIDLLDLSTMYFGMPIDEDKLLRIGCDDMGCDKRNKVIKKRDAISFFLQNNPLKNGEQLYCSINAISASQIKDYYGEKIFPEVQTNLLGWFFFLDEAPYANWKHECKYYFVIDTEYFFSKRHIVGISDAVIMEKIM